MIRLFLLSVTICLLIETSSTDNGLAQEQEAFSLYENPVLGIRLQYPVGWEVIENVDFDDDVAGTIFSSPNSATGMESYASIGIKVRNLAVSNTTLTHFANNEINLIKAIENFKNILQSNSTTIAGLPATSIKYVQELPTGKELKTIETFTINNSIGYSIYYKGTGQAYSVYLPIAQKSINSLQLIGETSTPKDLSGFDILRQQEEIKTFSTYEDPILGIKMEYPSNWKAQPVEDGVAFNPIFEEEDISSGPAEHSGLTVENLNAMNAITLNQYVREKMKDFRTDENFKIRKLNSTATFGGNPAQEIIFDVGSGELDEKWLMAFTVKNNTGYVFNYFIGEFTLNVSKSELDQYFGSRLPTIKTMIDSFQIL